MADTKISALTELAEAPATNDVVAIVDTDASATKKLTVANLFTTPAITGNMTTTGTIDGRDIATDGTKLDGIEASADVTGETNVTAAFPISDATTLVKDPADATKLVRIDAGAITTSTTRVITMGDRDVDLASGGTFAENSHTHATTDITSGTFADARVAESNVTQHEAAINHDNLTGFVANEHVDHTSVTVTVAGTTDEIDSSAGAQDISASRTWTIGLADNAQMPGTEGINVAGGTTGERPGVPVEGDLRKNTSTNVIEYWDGSSWVDLTAGAGGGISNVVEDVTPQLGGDLDAQTFDIQFQNGNGLHDNSDNEVLLIGVTASAVNEITVTNAATAGSPSITATGGDADIDLTLDGKGTGTVKTTSSNLDITGNIIVSGTVDGRDVATDGTKLDGIEALADVTSETNVTAALPVSDATSIVKDPADATKTLRLDVGGNTTSVEGVIATAFTTAKTVTLPDATDTLVGKATTDTLTNKTLADFTNTVNADNVHVEAYNNTGGTLSKGAPVYISGYNVGQDLIEIDVADANVAAEMPALGLVAADILTASSGTVLISGVLDDLATNAYSVGDELYVSETAGALTATRPTAATSAVQKICIVTRSHATQGIVQIIGAGRSNDQPNTHTTDRFRVVDSSDTTKVIEVNATAITTATTRTLTYPDRNVDLSSGGTFAENSHTHAATDITSATLAHQRGGLEADVSAYDGLVRITGGSTSAFTLRGSGTAIDSDQSKSISVEDPTNAEDISIFFTNKAITVTEMRAVLVGSSTPSVTWTIRHGTDRSATGAEVVTSGTTTTSVSTGSDVTAFNDATIVADSFVWLETTAKSGTVDEIHITIVFDPD